MRLRKAPFRDARHVLPHLSQTHRNQGIVPASDPSLAYSLPVPKGWGRVTGLGASAAAGLPEIIGVFAPDPDLEGPRIIVSVTRLRWDVDPASWVRHGWEATGWGIAMAQPLDPRWHPRFEVGGLKRIGDRVEVRRATGFVDNGRLLRVDVAGPRPIWEKLHDLLWPCGVLMSLAKPTFRREVEPLVQHGGPTMRFALPESWRALPQPPPWTGTSRWVASPMEGEEGSAALRIEATRWPGSKPEALERRQRRLAQELWERGIALGGRFERVPAALAAGTPGLAGVFAARARDHEEDFELRVAHRDVEGWSLDYAAVIASPERCPLDRMRTLRALEIAVSTTETRPKELTPHAA